ncbi:hypothetical protein GCM10007906_46210 [Vibrio hyugaensis]|uniref:Uncharacterized protein n=1 Tax=Vibrio hyugaensis TaxID=1534743 RepID=A0ABQ5YBL5_9VIBR|nr:hypothetical protein GCM10007906_46210 [Vibrio hyugaensis]
MSFAGSVTTSFHVIRALDKKVETPPVLLQFCIKYDAENLTHLTRASHIYKMRKNVNNLNH